MARMIVRRVLIAIPLLAVVSFVVFALTSLAEDPARQILGDGATPEAVATLRTKLGLDQSLLHRYGDWLSDLFHGSLGRSWFGNVPVGQKILDGLPVTAALVLSSIVLTALVAIPAGLQAGRHAGGRFDRTANVLAGVSLAMPEFWVGLLLILVLGTHLHVLPGVGPTRLTSSLGSDISHLILPVIALSLPQICALYRQTRAAAGLVSHEDYIRTARAGGLTPRAVLWTRVAKNALVPSVTLLGLQLGRMIGVAAVVESVFGMYGIGSIAVRAALSSDIPIILGVVLVTALVVMLANLLADIAVHYLAPRTRTS